MNLEMVPECQTPGLPIRNSGWHTGKTACSRVPGSDRQSWEVIRITEGMPLVLAALGRVPAASGRKNKALCVTVGSTSAGTPPLHPSLRYGNFHLGTG